MKNTIIIKKVLISLIIIFVFILAFFVLLEDPNRNLFAIVAILGILFLALGVYLTILAKKESGKLRTYLLITAISSIAPFISVILHNFFYGLAIAFPNLSLFFEFLHASFFILALVIAPILFLVGIVGSMILIYKEKGK
ncbi:hypothetical protein K8R20_00060 [bacterium]|nr:hypothetical protein [bacterium]